MATSIHPSIPVLSPSFLYHPYIPSLELKDFSFTCILSTTVLSDIHVRKVAGIYVMIVSLSQCHYNSLNSLLYRRCGQVYVSI